MSSSEGGTRNKENYNDYQKTTIRIFEAYLKERKAREPNDIREDEETELETEKRMFLGFASGKENAQ